MTTISIALATFNGQRFLGDQLASLAEQEVLPNELVVTDDGSTDYTMAALRAFARSAPFPVRIFQNEVRLGHRANFVKAAAECNGDLIAFCDQDDVWCRQKLRLMREVFAEPEVLLAFHNSRLIDETGIGAGTIYPRRRRGRIYGRLATPPWEIIVGHGQVMRQSLRRLDGLHPESIDPFVRNAIATHDYWYPFWASALGKIAYVPEILVDYRQHGGNASGWPYASWAGYLLDHIANAESYAIGNISGAVNRLHLLARSADLLKSTELQHVHAAKRAYEVLLQRYVQRLGIYRERRIKDRLRNLCALLKEGAYSSKYHRGFGFDTLLLDTFIGVLGPPLGRVKPSAK